MREASVPEAPTLLVIRTTGMYATAFRTYHALRIGGLKMAWVEARHVAAWFRHHAIRRNWAVLRTWFCAYSAAPEGDFVPWARLGVPHPGRGWTRQRAARDFERPVRDAVTA